MTAISPLALAQNMLTRLAINGRVREDLSDDEVGLRIASSFPVVGSFIGLGIFFQGCGQVVQCRLKEGISTMGSGCVRVVPLITGMPSFFYDMCIAFPGADNEDKKLKRYEQFVNYLGCTLVIGSLVGVARIVYGLYLSIFKCDFRQAAKQIGWGLLEVIPLLTGFWCLMKLLENNRLERQEEAREEIRTRSTALLTHLGLQENNKMIDTMPLLSMAELEALEEMQSKGWTETLRLVLNLKVLKVITAQLTKPELNEISARYVKEWNEENRVGSLEVKIQGHQLSIKGMGNLPINEEAKRHFTEERYVQIVSIFPQEELKPQKPYNVELLKILDPTYATMTDESRLSLT